MSVSEERFKIPLRITLIVTQDGTILISISKHPLMGFLNPSVDITIYSVVSTKTHSET